MKLWLDICFFVRGNLELIDQTKSTDKTQEETDGEPSIQTDSESQLKSSTNKVEKSIKSKEKETTEEETNSNAEPEGENTEIDNKDEPINTPSVVDNGDEKSQSESVKSKIDSAESTRKLTQNDGSTCSEDTFIDVEDPDDYLLYLETILLKIHSKFYSHYDETNQVSVCPYYSVHFMNTKIDKISITDCRFKNVATENS